ncbi:hypothetical protein NP493_88g00045 [Ridgeia piscesae]|uniref:Uncharacterized protein n=1 Tax=Ridgeia piscesae TaxID=27915 RepID=A0AAD9P8E7_RIDPI|nr:hypothetical protein NP493_88g00045 [Ridgeia piscesae]
MRYKAKAEYAPGKDPVVADALSRSPIQINPVKVTNVAPEEGRVAFLYDGRCYSSVSYHPHVDWMAKLREGRTRKCEGFLQCQKSPFYLQWFCDIY